MVTFARSSSVKWIFSMHRTALSRPRISAVTPSDVSPRRERSARPLTLLTSRWHRRAHLSPDFTASGAGRLGVGPARSRFSRTEIHALREREKHGCRPLHSVADAYGGNGRRALTAPPLAGLCQQTKNQKKKNQKNKHRPPVRIEPRHR